MSFEAVAQRNASVRQNRATMLYLLHVWTIMQMEIWKLRKDPFELVVRGVQPALWLLVFGEAFSRLRAIPTGTVNYLAFLTPGILAQSITFISIFYGIAVIWERDMGLLQKFLSAPMYRSALILGKMLAASVRSLTQATMIVILAALIGVHLQWDVVSLAGVLGTVILGAAFFSGLSLVLAALLRTRERLMGIGQLITMPLFFSSNALYPTSIMPPWLRVVAAINPMSYLVDGLRGLLLGVPYHWMLDGIVLAAATVFMLVLASLLFPRRMAN
jgi:ABC-2 type transport system permease protein